MEVKCQETDKGSYNIKIFKQTFLKLSMVDKDIGKINKGEYQGTTTDIVVGIREYNGRVGIDIREFTTSEKYTGPTKKGLRIPAEKFQEFKQMINSISQGDLKASDGESSSKPAQKKFEEEMPDY
jgi:hypothetical protein